MDLQQPDLLDKLRQQFNSTPYPRIGVAEPPNLNPLNLYVHNLVTPYYLRQQKVTDTRDKVILDAGCGSGYKALSLAIANPGAKIIGVDISEASVKVAQERLEHHGFKDAKFYAMSLEDLPQLGMQFDYINNDEVLYLIPDPAAGLQAMQSVLKPEGIIRTNLHSKRQRRMYTRAQQLCKLLGLMDGNPEDAEIEMLGGLMRSLKSTIDLNGVWRRKFETNPKETLANHLLVGDKNFTILDLFQLLQGANLEFVRMVDGWTWNLNDLFKTSENLPDSLKEFLSPLSVADQLHVFELLQPIHRLLDFWCGHPGQGNSFTPVAEWTVGQWNEAKIHLHPQLQTKDFRAEVSLSLSQSHPLEISRYLPTLSNSILDGSLVANIILPLGEAPRSLSELVQRSQQIYPYNLQTLEPVSPPEISQTIINALTTLESVGCVLLELPT